MKKLILFLSLATPCLGQSINGIPNQSVPPPRFSQLFCTGDSYVFGYGATQPANGICPLLARDTQAPMRNYAANGLVVPQIALATFANYQADPNFPSVAYLNGGTNDAGNDTCGATTGTPCIINYQLGLDAIIAWLSIPYNQRQMGSVGTASGFIVDTGLPMKSNAPYASQGTPMAGVASGNTLTFSIPSSAATKIGITQTAPPSNNGTYTITIDGVVQTNPNATACSLGSTTFSGGPCGGSLVLSSANTLERNEFTVTPNTSHTVLISMTGGNFVTIISADWVLPTATAITNPVFFMNINATATNFALYNTAATTIVTQEHSAGLPVFLVNQPGGTPGVNATTDISMTATSTCPASLVSGHPNDCGYEHMRETVQNVENTNGYVFSIPNMARASTCGGGLGGYCLISTTSPSGVGTVTIPVPSGYKDVQVAVRGSSTAASFATLRLQINGDTSADYDQQNFTVNDTANSSAGTAGKTSLDVGWLPGAGTPAGEGGYSEILIGDYAGTTFAKRIDTTGAIKISGAASDFFLQRGSDWWNQTAAVTSITIFLDSGNFASGDTISIYGRN